MQRPFKIKLVKEKPHPKFPWINTEWVRTSYATLEAAEQAAQETINNRASWGPGLNGYVYVKALVYHRDEDMPRSEFLPRQAARAAAGQGPAAMLPAGGNEEPW